MAHMRMVARPQKMTRKAAYKAAVAVDANHNGSISRQELAHCVAISHAELWQLLADRLHLDTLPAIQRFETAKVHKRFRPTVLLP